jgi:site-specific DNA-methyltransferase (adenine-specific)
MKIEFYNEDCLTTLRRLAAGSIDLMLTDPPYGLTQNAWDRSIDLKSLWPEWERVVKPNGALIFTSAQPFTSQLIMSRIDLFRYDLIWHKPLGSGFLNAHKMPLRNHEHILVFYHKPSTYNPQMGLGIRKHGLRQTSRSGGNYRPVGKPGYTLFDDHGKRYPTSVISITNGNRRRHGFFHPTQKPVDLFRYLVRTYSNPGEIVFDGYAGSGTTAVACVREGRCYVGSEINLRYFSKASRRIQYEQNWHTYSTLPFTKANYNY